MVDTVELCLNFFLFQIFQRLGLARSRTLGKITTALPSIMKIDKTMKSLLSQLLTKSAYIFPLKAGTTVSPMNCDLTNTNCCLLSQIGQVSHIEALPK